MDGADLWPDLIVSTMVHGGHSAQRAASTFGGSTHAHFQSPHVFAFLGRRGRTGARRRTAGARAGRADEPAPKDKSNPRDTSPLGHTPHTKFAVNVEMWWHKLPFLERIKMAASSAFPAVEFWPWRGQGHRRRRAGSRKDSGIADRPVHRLGLHARHERSEEPRRASCSEVEEGCQVAKRLNCNEDVRRRRQRSARHDAGADAREHHRGARSAWRRSPRSTR